MGRYTTGAITTDQAIRLELSYLLKEGYIEQGKNIAGNLYWTNGSSIKVESDMTGYDSYLRLIYNNTNYNGETTNHNYKIQLTSIPSNLGIGNVIYFVCPVTYNRCRILYKCYGSLIWKSRFAYQNKIYYQSQVSSKTDYFNSRYWALERQLEDLYASVVKSHYRGRETALQRRIARLEYKQEYYDYMRCIMFKRMIMKYQS